MLVKAEPLCGYPTFLLVSHMICAVNYATSVCEELGYEFQVVYGDMYNDPAANLSAVKNAMTKDVVAIIASQDGGIKDIMAEYPGFICRRL